MHGETIKKKRTNLSV